MLIDGCIYPEISFHFCKDCRIFLEGEWEIENDGNAIVKQQSANNHIAFGPAFGYILAFGLAFGHNMAFGHIMASLHDSSHNMTFGLAFGHNMAFGPAFGHTMAFGHSELIVACIKSDDNVFHNGHDEVLPDKSCAVNFEGAQNANAVKQTALATTKLSNTSKLIDAFQLRVVHAAPNKPHQLIVKLIPIVTSDGGQAPQLIMKDAIPNSEGAQRWLLCPPIPKYPLLFERIAQYFVREYGMISNLKMIMESLALIKF